MRALAVLPLLLLAACPTVPRVSTIGERATVEAILVNIETALVVLRAVDELSAADLKLALEQVADLREAVALSETQPVSWAVLTQRATNIALQWMVQE